MEEEVEDACNGSVCYFLVLMTAACRSAAHLNSIIVMQVHSLMAVFTEMHCDLVHPHLYAVIFRAPSSCISHGEKREVRKF